VGTGSHEENASNKTPEPGTDAIRTDTALVANFKGASNPNSRGQPCRQAWRCPGQGGIACGFGNHDACRNLAGPGNGWRLRGLELP